MTIKLDNCAHELARITSEVRERFGEVQTEDGVFVERDDAWFVVRPSRTERVLRVTVEGTSRRRAKQLFEQVRSLVAPETSAIVA